MFNLKSAILLNINEDLRKEIFISEISSINKSTTSMPMNSHNLVFFRRTE